MFGRGVREAACHNNPQERWHLFAPVTVNDLRSWRQCWVDGWWAGRSIASTLFLLHNTHTHFKSCFWNKLSSLYVYHGVRLFLCVCVCVCANSVCRRWACKSAVLCYHSVWELCACLSYTSRVTVSPLITEQQPGGWEHTCCKTRYLV